MHNLSLLSPQIPTGAISHQRHDNKPLQNWGKGSKVRMTTILLRVKETGKIIYSRTIIHSLGKIKCEKRKAH